MLLAGEDFRDEFRRAHLDPLKAADLSRPVVSGRIHDVSSYRTERAKRAVHEAISAIGGIASLNGSCLWNVLGWEKTLRDWTAEQANIGRSISIDNATGIMIAALVVLKKHYGYGEQIA